MSWIPPSVMPEEYEAHNERAENRRFIGEVSGGDPVYYKPEDHRVQEGVIGDDGEPTPVAEGRSWDLDPQQDIGEFLERVGEDHGWDSLSSFAREHLTDDDGSS